jgi:hypothetical protein
MRLDGQLTCTQQVGEVAVRRRHGVRVRQRDVDTQSLQRLDQRGCRRARIEHHGEHLALASGGDHVADHRSVIGPHGVGGKSDEKAPISAAASTRDRGVATIDSDFDAESDLVSHDEPPPTLPSAGALDG